MSDRFFTIRVPKRWIRIAFAVGVTALIVAPITAWASHTFNDVPDSHTFHNDIEWLAEAGVTRGCNPPENTEFCPDDNVTRGQMAAFMKRFADYIDAQSDDALTGNAPIAFAAGTPYNASPVPVAEVDALTFLFRCVGGGEFATSVEMSVDGPGPLTVNGQTHVAGAAELDFGETNLIWADEVGLVMAKVGFDDTTFDETECSVVGNVMTAS